MLLRGGPGRKLSRSRPSPSAITKPCLLICVLEVERKLSRKAMCACRAVRAGHCTEEMVGKASSSHAPSVFYSPVLGDMASASAGRQQKQGIMGVAFSPPRRRRRSNKCGYVSLISLSLSQTRELVSVQPREGN
jgi:hypothetical protein